MQTWMAPHLVAPRMHRPWTSKYSEASVRAGGHTDFRGSVCAQATPSVGGSGPVTQCGRGAGRRGLVPRPAGWRTPQQPCQVFLLLRGRLGRCASSPALGLAEQTDGNPAGSWLALHGPSQAFPLIKSCAFNPILASDSHGTWTSTPLICIRRDSCICRHGTQRFCAYVLFM